MKTIVIYNSQTGFTKRYAQWIAEAAGADCLALPDAKKKDLTAYEAIIYGGWACAGSISKISWFKRNMDKWADKKLIAFCVGGSPIDSPEIDIALKRIFNEAEQEKVKTFYCPGGFNYERMSAPSKLMMKLFIKSLNAKKEKTEEIKNPNHPHAVACAGYWCPSLSVCFRYSFLQHQTGQRESIIFHIYLE